MSIDEFDLILPWCNRKSSFISKKSGDYRNLFDLIRQIWREMEWMVE